MGLLDFLGLKKQQPVQPVRTNGFGEPLDRLTPDGELPWGWIAANIQFTEKIQGEAQHFIDQWLSAEKKGALEEYAALKSYLLYLDDAKRLCESQGACFAKWFSDIIASQKQIDKWTAKLKAIEEKIKTK